MAGKPATAASGVKSEKKMMKHVQFDLVPLVRAAPASWIIENEDEMRGLFYQKEDYDRFRREARTEQLIEIQQQRMEALTFQIAVPTALSLSPPVSSPRPGRPGRSQTRAATSGLFSMKGTKSKLVGKIAKLQKHQQQESDQSNTLLKTSTSTSTRTTALNRRRRMNILNMNPTTSSPRVVASVSRTAGWI